MGFKLSRAVSENVTALALTMGENDEAVAIPDTPGMVLVRFGSKACLERKGNQGVFMIPVKLVRVLDGIETEDIFFVCTA